LSAAALSVGLLLALVSQSVIAATPSEYQLKAAFVFNFAKFVEWPAAAFRTGQSPITICIFGEDRFGRDLDELVKGQTIAGRSITVRRITQAPRGDACQVLFVSSGESSQAQQVLHAVANLPILTVSEDEQASRSGYIIQLLLEDNKVRFAINLESAERAGLKISSKLLKLAKRVHER
jgi:hypothetical protein